MKKSRFERFLNWVIAKCDVYIETNAVAVAEKNKTVQIEETVSIEDDGISLATAVAVISTIYLMK
jgi:hypothetical protein